MRLQRQMSRQIGNTFYSKWVLVIPPDKIREAGWREGTEIDIEIKGRTIVLKPKV
jgi:antitoxin component of MazEF toxin-antitoxin module